jgi:ribonucleoside-diphosphate reductase alpha chain
MSNLINYLNGHYHITKYSFEERANVQSTIQKYVDTAISSTFNLPNSATVEDVMNIYMTAWEKKLKGATVFRDRCAKIGILLALMKIQKI